MSQAKQDNIVFYLFLLPVFIIFLVVVVIPFLMGIVYSFTDWSAVPGKKISFIGFENYKSLIHDKDFFNSFSVTAIYTVISVVLINVIGFLLSVLVTQKIGKSNLFRTIFFMPNLIGGLILGFMWKFIFLKVFPVITTVFHLPPHNWLSSSYTALLSMAIVTTWQMSGYIMIIYIAAIQSIPASMIEASNIDGVNFLQKLRHIIFPLVAQAFTVSLFLTLSTCFKMFDINLALTNGGPAKSTELLTLNIYSTAFSKLQFGLGQSKAILFFLIISLITVIQVRTTKRREIEV